jgi:hypothetical protein
MLVPMPTKKKTPTKPYHLMVVLDEDDRRALEDAAQLEKLPKADSVRRAIRAYARKLRSQLSATG